MRLTSVLIPHVRLFPTDVHRQTIEHYFHRVKSHYQQHIQAQEDKTRQPDISVENYIVF